MSVAAVPAPASRSRSRLALAALFGLVLATNLYFVMAARSAATDMEARVLSGNFAAMHVERLPANVMDDGRVYLHPRDTEPTGYVASTNLVKGGQYQAVIIAEDEAAAKRAKAALVIAAQDAKGVWHPANAAAIAAKLAPHP